MSPLTDLLRCLRCEGPLVIEALAKPRNEQERGPNGRLRCENCGERYPIVGGTPRMVGRGSSSDPDHHHDSQEEVTKWQTAESFAYEWEHFGEPRGQWRKNFLDYMRPHGPEFFRGRLVLDVGAGSGRHSAEAAALGARVVAVDLGRSIDVARRNTPNDVLTVQADAERLPLSESSFDFVMSIGVLHHLPDPERALAKLALHAKPGGWVHIYLYWVPEIGWHRTVLALVTAIRRMTVRMPHKLLLGLCYPLSAFLWVGFVLPYRALRGRSRMRSIAVTLPLKAYADYPFAVLVNDQFDRFSAPLERRYTRADVENMLGRLGLEDVTVLSNHGWVAEGRVPSGPRPPAPD